MLGVLIARATGKSLGEFLQERIFAPLGMKDTGFSVPADKLDRLAGSYWTNFATGEFGVFDQRRGQPVCPARPPSSPAPAGWSRRSTISSPSAQMMLNNGKYGDERILSRPSVELMTTDQITPSRRRHPHPISSPASGTATAGDSAWPSTPGATIWRQTPGRYGWDGGYGTSWYVDPTEELIGILLTQRVWDAFPIPKVYIDFWTRPTRRSTTETLLSLRRARVRLRPLSPRQSSGLL